MVWFWFGKRASKPGDVRGGRLRKTAGRKTACGSSQAESEAGWQGYVPAAEMLALFIAAEKTQVWWLTCDELEGHGNAFLVVRHDGGGVERRRRALRGCFVAEG